jgi:hypothetical protein
VSLKYLGGTPQSKYGLVEETSEDEASSLLLRYVRRPGPLLRPEGCGRRDVLLQSAMLLCLVGAAGCAVEPSVEDKTGAYSLTTPSGEEHQFTGIVDVARWATATAFG